MMRCLAARIVPVVAIALLPRCDRETPSHSSGNTPPQQDVRRNVEGDTQIQRARVEAVDRNDLATVRRLIEGCDDLSFITNDGYDHVTHALNSGSEEVASFLIDAPINLANPASEFTPMQCALEQPYYELIDKLLAKRDDLNVKGTSETGFALHVLCRGYLEPDLVQRFLDAGADPCARDDEGQTALDIAREVEGPAEATAEIVRILVEAMKRKGCG